MAMQGSRVTIPLNSPLDINSDDMLVNVNKPTFEYNRQKYLGSLLQTSVRYEADGWFAGWWGHNFDLVNDREDYVTPPLYDPEHFSISPRTSAQGYKYFIIQHKDLALRYTYVVPPSGESAAYTLWTVGGGSVTRIDDTTVRIIGTTALGNAFTVDIDPYTGLLKSEDYGTVTSLYSTASLDGMLYKLEVARNQEPGSEYIDIRFNKPSLLNGVQFVYSLELGAISKWDSYFAVDATDPELKVYVLPGYTELFEVLESTISYKDTVNEVIHALIYDKSICEINNDIEYKELWTRDIFTAASVQLDSINSNSSGEPSNRQEAQIVTVPGYGSPDFIYNNEAVAKYALPIWLQNRIDATYSVKFTQYRKPTPRTTLYGIDFTGVDEEFDLSVIQPDLRHFIDRANNWDNHHPSTWERSVITDENEVIHTRYSYNYTNMPRYNELGLYFSTHTLVTQLWDPYKEVANPTYDPRPRVANDVPYGCMLNPAYVPYYEIHNGLKSALAKDAIKIADIDAIPDFVPLAEYPRLYIIDPSVSPSGYVTNEAFQPDPRVANYDPRPVISRNNPSTWLLISAPNNDQDNTARITNVNYNVKRYFIQGTFMQDDPATPDTNEDTRRAVFMQDWSEVSQYWRQYYFEPGQQWLIPIARNDSLAPPNIDGYESRVNGNGDVETARSLTISMYSSPITGEPDTAGEKVNEPDAPPKVPPYSGQVSLQFKNPFGSLHTLINEVSTNPDEYDFSQPGATKLGVKWQFAVKKHRRIRVHGRIPYGGWFRDRYWVYDQTQHQYFQKTDANNDAGISAAQFSNDAFWTWQDISEIYQSTIHNYVAGDGNWWNRREEIFDDWVIALRCINLDTGFPVPPNENYFWLKLTCNGQFRENNNLLAITTGRVLHTTQYGPEYGAMYNNNYKVLNMPYLFDPGLLTWANGELRINVPLCVAAHSFVHVTTPAILESGKDAFAIRTIRSNGSRDDIPLNIPVISENCWRIDDAGYTDEQLGTVRIKTRLNLANPNYASILSTSPDVQKMQVVYNGTGAAPLYEVKMKAYEKDMTTGEITLWNNDMYPAWILSTPARKYDASQAVVPVLPSQDAMTIMNVTVNLQINKYIQNIVQSKDILTKTRFNQALFNDITPEWSITIPDATQEVLTQTVTLKPDTVEIASGNADYATYTYHVEDGEYTEDSHTFGSLWQYHSWSTSKPAGFNTTANNIKLNIQRLPTDAVEVAFYRTFILRYNPISPDALAAGMHIQSQVGTILTFNEGYGYFDISIARLIDPVELAFILSEGLTDNGDDSTYIRIYVGINNSAIVYYTPAGIIQHNRPVEYVSTARIGTTALEITIDYAGNPHIVHVDLTESNITTLLYTCTDIRTGDKKEVYRRDLSDVYMFIKQFWSNDVTVENYWWLDPEHILELNKYDIVLKEKVPGEVDDWNGDVWREVASTPRSIYIDTATLYYSVTCALKGRPYFIKFYNKQNTGLELWYADILSPSFDFANPIWTKVTIPVKHIKLGDSVSTAELCSYIELNIDAIPRVARISSTVINNVLLIGIALTRGLQQWTIKIDSSGNITVVTGYGHVGIDGTLTGGQIPTHKCNGTGFFGAVAGLDTLPDTMGARVTDMTVGTESTVWFIKERVTGFISHMLYNNGTFIPVEMKLNNNLAERYESVSIGADGLFDIIPFAFNLTQLFTNNAAINAIGAIVSPSVLAFNPKYTMLGHISHSLGQYAYVWRNSTQNQVNTEPALEIERADRWDVETKRGNGLSSTPGVFVMPGGADNSIDRSYTAGGARGSESNGRQTDRDIAFGTYAERNVQIARGGVLQNVFLQVVIKAIGNVIDRVQDAAINISKGAGLGASAKQAAKDFGLFTLDNTLSTVADAINTTGFIISMKSQLKRIRTLDMFYSINNKVECWAGPGFVNHNLQGQCIAQSVTDRQTEGKRVAFWALFAELSVILEEQKRRLYGFTREKLLEWANGAVSIVIPVSPGAGIPIGQAIAAALFAAATALDVLIAASEMATEGIVKLCQTIGGSPSGVPYLHGMLSKRDLFTEGTHAYGNKSMSLFWPAFGVATPNTYTDEEVSAEYKIQTQKIELGGLVHGIGELWQETGFRTLSEYNDDIVEDFDGDLASVAIYALGKSKQQTAPVDMAIVEGTTAFLPTTKFRNEQIGASYPVFVHPPVHDYCINKQWQIGFTAAAGEIVAVSCDDTKIIDGPPSNMVITDDFCGIASSYIALEIKNVFDYRYLRPVTITPNAVALNINRVNCVHDAKAYHAFDGQVNRIVKWTGGAGLDKELLFQQYLFQINDHFKRSNIFPPSQFFGSFNGPPSVAIRSYEPVANQVQELTSRLGIENNTPGEEKSVQRFSLPVHSEPLSTLPAVNRMLAPYKLHVPDGVTALTTDLRNTQTRYKAPSSVDFAINGILYRATEEFIGAMQQTAGANAFVDMVASAGLTFIGATTTAGYFYSAATKLYYKFAGQKEITKQDIMTRFTTVDVGRWDFINQEVIFKATHVEEDMVLRLDNGGVMGEVWPPNETIYNKRSGFKLFSVAGGLVFQGPKRFIVSRFVALDHMIPQIIQNKKKWKKVDRESFNFNRDYGWKYENFDTETPLDAVYGWTHNPFLLSTSMLGTNEETDCKFEWTFTFAWTSQMEKIFETKEYVTVNVMAETVTQGGTVYDRPTHIYLFKECFTREGNAGYYTFKFQSNNGIGNRERIFIWSDGFIAAEDVSIDCKEMTTNRTQPLHTQVDVKDLIEL